MKRREGESFEDYKKRRAEADKELEEYLSEINILRIVKVTRKEFEKVWGINERQISEAPISITVDN